MNYLQIMFDIIKHNDDFVDVVYDNCRKDTICALPRSKEALNDDYIDLLDEFGLYSFETRPGYWFSDRLTGEKKWIEKAPGPVYISKIPFDKEV